MQEDSQALVFATKIFLVLQLAVLPSMWLWLQKPRSYTAAAAFISLRNTEDDGRCFLRWAAKWLPLSKGWGCTWLTDSCVSSEIVRHLDRPDRKKGQQESGGKRWRKKTERSCLDSMPEKLSQISNVCRVKLWFQMLAIWLPKPTSTPLILLSLSAHHKMCRLALRET